MKLGKQGKAVFGGFLGGHGVASMNLLRDGMIESSDIFLGHNGGWLLSPSVRMAMLIVTTLCYRRDRVGRPSIPKLTLTGAAHILIFVAIICQVLGAAIAIGRLATAMHVFTFRLQNLRPLGRPVTGVDASVEISVFVKNPGLGTPFYII